MAKVSFEALNRVAGDALACMLLPAAQLLPDDDAHALRYPRRLSMAMLVAHLCPSPESKLLTVKYLPIVRSGWINVHSTIYTYVTTAFEPLSGI